MLIDASTNRPLVPRQVAARELAYRVMIPSVVLVALGLVVGWVVVPPLSAATGEDRLNVLLQAGRTPLLDTVARTASLIGGVSGNAVICVLAVAALWLATRQWWIAALPAAALTLHIWVHITTSTLVARDRPGVPALDIGQPTASFPSGHMGATLAQLLVVALVCWTRINSLIVRLLVVVVLAGYLVLLGWSRIYLGMHHPTDIAWGLVNGVACGLIAWLYLRTNPAAEARSRASLATR